MFSSGNLKPDRKTREAHFEKDVKPSHVLTDALFNPWNGFRREILTITQAGENLISQWICDSSHDQINLNTFGSAVESSLSTLVIPSHDLKVLRL